MRNILIVLGIIVFILAGYYMTQTVSIEKKVEETTHIEQSIQSQMKQTQAALSKPSPLAQEAALHFAIQDEYKAEAMYEAVLDKFGQVKPFATIVNAESRHSRALARVMQNLEIEVPSPMPITIVLPETMQQTCAQSVEAEKENIALYERLLGQVSDTQVRQVFENNMSASRDNHLPAFERCAR